MSTETLYMKRYDLQPYYYAQVVDSDGDVIDLTGATIRCTMKSLGGTVVINRGTTGVTITNATEGYFEYRWQSGDTDALGTYHIEFEITPAAGGKYTLPAKPDEKALVHIVKSLDTV